VIEYDHLVLALGTVTDFRGLRGLPEHALPFKNLNDALYLRNHVIRALEEAAIERHDEKLRRQLLTFVVAEAASPAWRWSRSSTTSCAEWQPTTGRSTRARSGWC